MSSFVGSGVFRVLCVSRFIFCVLGVSSVVCGFFVRVLFVWFLTFSVFGWLCFFWLVCVWLFVFSWFVVGLSVRSLFTFCGGCFLWMFCVGFGGSFVCFSFFVFFSCSFCCFLFFIFGSRRVLFCFVRFCFV